MRSATGTSEMLEHHLHTRTPIHRNTNVTATWGQPWRKVITVTTTIAPTFLFLIKLSFLTEFHTQKFCGDAKLPFLPFLKISQRSEVVNFLRCIFTKATATLYLILMKPRPGVRKVTFIWKSRHCKIEKSRSNNSKVTDTFSKSG